MPFNLISARWLPCRRASGARVWIAPHEITSSFAEDPILALDFPRPDWNAAVTELMIGLLSTTLPPVDADTWAAAWLEPPPPETLEKALAPLVFAFNLDGDGPRAFQDLAPLGNAEAKSIGTLLIEAPGDNTAKENKDLFVKREGVTALSLPYAAAALVTLQTYAPSGGQGNRTSMRGGGPLTLLVAPRRRHPRHGVMTTLWDVVWSNVRQDEEDVPPLTAATSRDSKRWARVFPWLAETRTSSNDEPTTPVEHADPLQAYFGMPRRIRLANSAEANAQRCSLGGPLDYGSVAELHAVNYGVMYTAWEHPLSPYYIDKKGQRFPFHPQPGLSTYADWFAWWGMAESVPAKTLKLWPERLGGIADQVPDLETTRQQCVLAIGFDMDNMKARGFLDERIPYFEPRDTSANWTQEFQTSIRQLIAGAKEAASSLKYALRLNMFGKRDGAQFKLLDNAPKDAFDDVVAALWAETQPAFVTAVGNLHAGDTIDADKAIRTEFLKALRRTAFRLFDDASNIDSLADQNARRLIEAKRMLVVTLGDAGKAAAAMQLVDAKPKGKGGKGGKRRQS
jgi:CRISPR system Cascade subunit CasA